MARKPKAPKVRSSRRRSPGRSKALVKFNLDPVGKDQRCIARRKSCPKCGWRYLRGDKSWFCPKCNSERRCGNKAAYGTMVCRMHGGKTAKEAKDRNEHKYHIAHQIAAAYDRVIGDPELLSLVQEIGMVTARIDDLMQQIDEYDNRGASKEITDVLQTMENAIYMARSLGGKNAVMDIGTVQMHAVRLKKVMEPVNVEMRLWDMLSMSMELLRRLNETERKWIISNEGMTPVVFVLELLARIQRLVMKYIRNPEDRIAFSREFHAQMPISVTLPPADRQEAA